MGIQDRDYMRDRGRHERRGRDLKDLLAGMERPFRPSKPASLLPIFVFWIGLAAALYAGYSVWTQKERAGAGAKPKLASVPQLPKSGVERDRPTNAEREPQNASQHRPAPRTIPAMQESPRPAPEVNAAPPATAGTIYLCKAYSGGTFWAQSHCSQHQALIDSMVPVPAGMPFAQQVELAQQQRAELARTLYATPAPTPVATPAASNKAECQALDRQVEELDALARQPQSAQVQDRIRGDRKAARDRQFAIRC
jgi:hypothetical protein